MNSELISVIIGFCLGFYALQLWSLIQFVYDKVKTAREYKKHPRLIPYNAAQACDPKEGVKHQWRDVQLAMRGLPIGAYGVCELCGSIRNHDEFMVSNEVLDQMEEGFKLLAQKQANEQKVYDKIRSLTDEYVDQYIAHHFKDMLSVRQLERLIELSKYTLTAYADASEKVAAQLTAETDTERRLASWGDSNEGGHA